MKIKKNVYPHSFDTALKKGEEKLYRESTELNQQCSSAISKALIESHYAPNDYDLESAARKVIDVYGSKRVAWILASAIRQSFNRGNYSDSNKAWAKSFNIPTDSDMNYNVLYQPRLVDGLVDAARLIIEREKAAHASKRKGKKPSNDELKSKLEKVAAFIVETCAGATTSGNYILDASDFPSDMITPDLLKQNINTVVEMLYEYEAVADVVVGSEGSIDICMYLAYCPNYEPWREEADEYPPNREILDPLKSKRVPESEPKPAVKPTLAEKLEANKQKAARQGQPDTAKRDKNKEV